MPDFEREEPTGQIDESVDVDSLMESVESQGRGGIPMTHEGQTDAPAADASATQAPDPAAAAAQAVEEFEITWNGRQIKAPKDKVLQWASQGYDYPQKMAELKKQREEFDRAYSPYKTVDDYAKQNPEWWKHVESSFQARKQGGQTDGASAIPELSHLKEELSSLKEFKTKFEQAQEQERVQKEDSALDTEVKSIRDQYANLDWKSVDQEGFTLEQRVLKHAVDTGINSFRAAFRDYNHDHLLKYHSDQAKADAAKELKTRNKQGLLGTSSTPKKGVQALENIKTKSYDDAFREAKEELGIA